MQNHPSSTRKRNSRGYLFLLCAAGLLINFVGVHLARGLKLPLYLDNIGSALAAALGGYIPGIIVGFLTNLVNGLDDYETAYYGSLTVMIAVASAYYASKGYYKKVYKLPVIILTFAFIGGVIGSILTWLLYGLSFGSGISAPLAHRIFAAGHLSEFWSQLSADVLIDLADKTITVVIIALVLKLLPARLRDRFYFYGWQQAPLSSQAQQAVDAKNARGISLRVKIILLVAAATLVTAMVVTAISFIHYRTAAINEQTELAQGVVQVMQDTIDHDRIDEYIEQGEAAEGYLEVEAVLKHLMDSTENIEYCYVYRILEDGCHVVFDPDTDDLPGEDPGAIVGFDNAFDKYLPDLLAGKPIEPVVSNETYGWLLTIYDPVYDSNGVCQCYAAVDINMSHIATSGYQFLARVISLFFGFFIMILTVGIWLAEYNIILPINSMALTSGRFAYDSESAREGALESIEALDIRTGDEIENLYHSMVKTTEDMVKFIAQMERQNQVIGKLQNGLILVLADMVESRDQCTGDHVRKTAAYTRIIMDQLRKEGVYLDQLTDEFVYDVENSAPLHDVGKIQVPDAILNKPGKLTDEEFEIMKTHTTAGSEIIARAMDMVSEGTSGYLKEAMNLAHYHHEKWNGRGYPCGLKGQDIPLSARIMAVADVFDALVSRRSYKEGFPYEKAMAIIQEGSGSHFDPAVAGAFMRAGDEVRRVMNMYLGN
ncbi:MAG: HD domain-containing protein [Clostridia bacterium]|nr:HD domain-containing protein [Clostridia bacterium]